MTIRVGDYQTVRALGHGGTAGVHLGRRLSDGARVAMKVVPIDAAGGLRREAALAAAIDHPHLPAVLDVVTEGEWAVLVTELAVGGSLADLLARRDLLTPEETLTVLIPLAAVLAVAHERQVVHGDVTPANVLFDGAARPLLADLGAARTDAEGGDRVWITPAAAAPEVARGGPPTPAADLFGLGSVALSCLTGRPAWAAETTGRSSLLPTWVDGRTPETCPGIGRWPRWFARCWPPIRLAGRVQPPCSSSCARPAHQNLSTCAVSRRRDPVGIDVRKRNPNGRRGSGPQP